MFKRTTTQVFLALISIVLFIGYSANPPNGRTGAPGDGTCNDCHSGGGSFDGNIAITGLPADVMAGNTYPLTVTVSNPNGLAVKGGFQIVALNSSNSNAGTLSNAGANSTISASAGRSYHEHNPAQSFPGSNMVSYTVDWTAPSGPNGETITFYGAGNIANGNGNTSGDKIVYLSQSTNLIANATPPVVEVQLINPISCNGDADASAEATGSEGTPPYSFIWSNGQNGSVATNLGPGTYTVTLTDDGGQTATDMITITEPSAVFGNHTINNQVSCAGGTDGSATISGSGGTPGYTFLWSDGNTTAIHDMLSAGTYGYTISDSNGCTFSSSLTITQPNEIITLIDIIEQPTCPGSSDGIVAVSSTGGTAPFTYEWSNGGEGPIQNNLSAGLYTITTTDSNNCKNVSDFELSDPEAIIIVLDSLSHVDCFGNMTGYIAISLAGGGTPPFDYLWSNGSTVNVLPELFAGDYSVTVSDNNNCAAVATYTINEPDSLTAVPINLSDVLCFGDSTGYVEIMVNGGTAPYEYTWSNGYMGGAVNDGLAAGSYTVSITDANNCTASTSFMIIEPAEFQLSLSSTNESFPGANDGSASASPTGGVMPYSYIWSNDSTSQTITGLSAGNYSVTVTDANGCSNEASVIINAGDCDLMVTNTIVNASCFGAQDGSAAVSVSGGIEPYSYAWDNGATDSLITMQSAGNYTLTITDNAACSFIISLSIDEPDSIQIMFDQVLPACPNENSGSLTANVTGGTGPYQYLWTTGDTSNAIIDIPIGNYGLSITDANSCVFDASIMLDFLDTIAPLIELQDLNIYLDETGQAGPISMDDFIVNVEDNCEGPVNVSFLADDYDCNDLDSIFNILVIASDLLGNSTEDTFQLHVMDTIPPDIVCISDITINSCTPFEYDLPEVSDNCGNLSIVQLQGLGSGSIFPIGDTEEIYMVTDESGNTSSCSFTITAVGDLSVTIDIEDESCADACNGSVIVTILGGTPPYTIEPEDLTDLCPGTYQVNITDAQGCMLTADFVILEAPAFEITNIVAQDASASGDDGSINLEIQGGVEPLSFNWTKDDQPFSMEQNLTGLSPGTYECIITDNNGCVIFTEEIIINMESGTNDDALEESIRLFPNPASDILVISHSLATSDIFELELIGVDGTQRYRSNQVIESNFRLPLDRIPEGIYVIRISTALGAYVKPVLIVH